MRILVTNDDGIDSVGLHVLARAMRPLGDVTVVAPDQEYSGAGASLGALHLIRPEVHEARIDGIDRAWSVSGPPGLCVIYSRLGLFGDPFDLVVAGINTGANVGNGVLGSGTTMATRPAWARSIPSIAVSLSRDGPQDQKELLFHLAATVSELLARSMADGEMPPGLTLNVNVPNVPRGEIRGIAVTRLSPISYWRLRTEQDGDGLYYNKLSAIAAGHPDIEEGTDVWALNKGLISITPLRLEVTDDKLILALSEHTRRLESGLKQMM